MVRNFRVRYKMRRENQGLLLTLVKNIKKCFTALQMELIFQTNLRMMDRI